MPQQYNPNHTYDNESQPTPLQRALQIEMDTVQELISLPESLYHGLCTEEEEQRIRRGLQIWQEGQE